MPPLQRKYSEIRDCMRPGDIIAFSGKKPFSEVIKWATKSNVSHVGVILQSRLMVDGAAQGRLFNQIAEATASGVKFTKLSEIEREYEGELWWLPLRKKYRKRLNFKKFSSFLIDNEGAPYDSLQTLIKAGTDQLDGLPDFLDVTQNREDFESFFCSELAAGALEVGGVLNNVNASEITPVDLCRFNIYKKKYVQFKGDEKVIRRFNSVDPTGWGE